MLIDLVKVLIAFAILVKASIHDLRERIIPDSLWVVMIATGFVLSMVQFVGRPFNLYIASAQFLLIFLISNLMYHLLNFGGADAKALISLAVMFPVYPRIFNLPLLNRGFGMFAFTVLANSVLVAPFISILLFLKNIGERDGRLIYRFIGVKVDADNVPKFYNLLEYVDERGRIVRVLRGVEPDEEMLKRLREAKKKGLVDKVWATPALPFIVFLTAGFVVSVVLGDLMVWIMARI